MRREITLVAVDVQNIKGDEECDSTAMRRGMTLTVVGVQNMKRDKERNGKTAE